MKVDRLIGIITLLLQRDQVTAPWLAERFEVSRRTINRDIEDICRAGIPLVTTQGFGGGISIDKSYKIDKILFTREELQAILTGLKGIDSVSQTSHQARFLEKMGSRENQIEAEDTIIIDLASHYQEALTLKIDVLRRAIQEHRQVTFRYYYGKGESGRLVEPYRLVFLWSSWYLFGYCLKRGAFRLFKLNRLWELTALEEGFLPRRIPESELQFSDYFESERIHLKALFAESEKYRLIEEYGIDCCSACESGGLLFERDFASYDNMREWIFSFGDRVRILEPESLRVDRIRQARNLLKMEDENES